MIEISWELLITNIVTFLVAMVIVWKLFWGPLQKMMKSRSDKIANDIQQTEKGRNEVQALEADYKRRLAEIEEKVRKELNRAVQKGNAAKEEIIQTARQEAQRILEKAQKDLALEREQVLRELRKEVSELALTAAENLLRENLDKKIQTELLNGFIGKVKTAEKAKQ